MIAGLETYMRMKPRRLLVARSEIAGRLFAKLDDFERANGQARFVLDGHIQILEMALARIEEVWQVRNLGQMALLPFSKPLEAV